MFENSNFGKKIQNSFFDASVARSISFKNETFCGTLIHCVFPVAWKKLLENDDDVRNKTVKVQKSIGAESRFAAAAALHFLQLFEAD